jgi:hypothetical protein
MRASFAFALRRGTARLVLGLGALGFVWAGLNKVWPWTQGSMKPEVQVPFSPAASPWVLPVAVGVFVLALALSVLIYRRWPSSGRRNA